MVKLEYHGDFADFACDSCHRSTRVLIKGGALPAYFCAYCGLRMDAVLELLFKGGD